MRIPVVTENESPPEPADTDTFVVVAPRRDGEQREHTDGPPDRPATPPRG